MKVLTFKAFSIFSGVKVQTSLPIPNWVTCARQITRNKKSSVSISPFPQKNTPFLFLFQKKEPPKKKKKEGASILLTYIRESRNRDNEQKSNRNRSIIPPKIIIDPRSLLTREIDFGCHSHEICHENESAADDAGDGICGCFVWGSFTECFCEIFGFWENKEEEAEDVLLAYGREGGKGEKRRNVFHTQLLSKSTCRSSTFLNSRRGSSIGTTSSDVDISRCSP